MRKQGVALEHRIDLPFDGRQAGDVRAGQKNLTGIGRFKSGDNFQQGRLAAPRRTQKGKKFTGHHLQGNVVKHLDPVKALGYVTQIKTLLGGVFFLFSAHGASDPSPWNRTSFHRPSAR